jgi:hypothetical protein
MNVTTFLDQQISAEQYVQAGLSWGGAFALVAVENALNGCEEEARGKKRLAAENTDNSMATKRLETARQHWLNRIQGII